MWKQNKAGCLFSLFFYGRLFIFLNSKAFCLESHLEFENEGVAVTENKEHMPDGSIINVLRA
jgi:hypothetical protein